MNDYPSEIDDMNMDDDEIQISAVIELTATYCHLHVKALFYMDLQQDIVAVVANNMEELLVLVLEDTRDDLDVEYSEDQYRTVLDVLLVLMMMGI
jgi:hypothetical protein